MRFGMASLTLAMITMSGSALSSQGSVDTWERLQPAVHPSPRYWTTMVYDERRDECLLVGGQTGANLGHRETWGFDGSTWTLRAAANATPPLKYASPTPMAYFAATGFTVLLTGPDHDAQPSETWTWDGKQWRQLRPVHSPTGRTRASMVYDEARKVVVLFGGDQFRTKTRDWALSDETWEWNGVDWTKVVTRTRPPARWSGMMAYDADRRRTVLYGGFNGVALADTWEYDGVNWKQIATPNRPPALADSAMTYDRARGRVLLFGGGTGFASRRETWLYDGLTWQQVSLPKPPSARWGSSTAYDSLRNRSVVFGGQTDKGESGETFLLSMSGTARFGAGCANGARAVPRLTSPGKARPVLGSTTKLRAEPVPQGSRGAALLLGASRTTWQNLALPLAIGGGCMLRVSVDATLPAVPNASFVDFGLFVPNQPALLGAEVYAQALLLNAANPVLPLALSNAIFLRVGK